MAEDRGCTVYIPSGTGSGTYYVNCDQVQYLDSDLTNNSNSTITLYSDRNYQTTQGPYIQIGSHRYPRYYSQQGVNYTILTNVPDVEFNGWSNMYRDKPILTAGYELIVIAVCICAILIKK